MSLQTLYRPSSLKQFIGNEDVKEALSAVLSRKKPPSAFLFTGPAGCGKTTLGRILRKELKCDPSSFEELNGANDRTIAPIRDLIKSMRYIPLKGGKRVILLDEAHMIIKVAQEALLKALEEPPEYVHWILCTTEPNSLKPSLKRRCHHYEVEMLPSSTLMKLLKRILKKEKVKNYPQPVLDKIIDISDGSAGVALKLLDMVIDFKSKKKAFSVLKRSGTTEEDIRPICKALIDFDLSDDVRWSTVRKILKKLTIEPEQARRSTFRYLNAVMLNKTYDEGKWIGEIMSCFKDNVFDTGKEGFNLQCMQACNVLEAGYE